MIFAHKHRQSGSGGRRFRGRFTTCFAVVALVGQMSSLLHLALVRHELCAEHGEVIDVGRAFVARAAAGHPSVSPWAAAERARATASVAFTEAAAVPFDHDHCLYVAQRRDRVSLAPIRIARAMPPCSRAAPALPTRPPPPSLAVILVAPKNSPPAA